MNNQIMDLNDIYGTLHLKLQNIYTFFSSTTGTFTNVLDNGRSVNKFQKTEIIKYAL